MLWAGLISFLGCIALLWTLLRFTSRLPQDVPNERSLHERPVPRTGGIAVLGGVGLAAAASLLPFGLPLALALGLAIVSFFDDLHTLPTIARLAVHVAAAAVLVWYLLSPMELWKLALLCIAVAWMTNLYNFMDGADGLAGGMAAVGFGAYALAASASGEQATGALCAALAAAAAAFLLYNFHPARIFLGDVGSIPIGFLAGALGVLGWRNDAWPLWFPLVVFGPFVGDATVTLARRALRGARFWTAHREHYYQRMVRMGLGHRRTALIAYAAMAACAAIALAGRAQSPGLQAAAFSAASTLLLALAVWVDFRWRRFIRRAGHSA